MKRLIIICALLLPCFGCAKTVRLDGDFTIMRSYDAAMLVIIEDESERARWLLSKSIQFKDGVLRKQSWWDKLSRP